MMVEKAWRIAIFRALGCRELPRRRASITMADPAKRLSSNVAGDFFVDSTCIDCDQCRELAPKVFGDGDGHASVLHQPGSTDRLQAALRALVTCPVGAIGAEQKHALSPVVAGFPEPVAENVHFCGFASPDSFGASSYLIVRREGNVLVDSPRFAARLVKRMEELGGVRWMFLSHVDDIADHAKFQRHFGCERIIHEHEVRSATADMEWKLTGEAPQMLAPDLLAIPTPGHTRGHTVLLYNDRFVFTGDHLWWSPVRKQLSASRSYCWYSWAKQVESMERLLEYRFEWVLPGHGHRHHASAAQMHESLAGCVQWMKGLGGRRLTE
jgi:glyoxylase-like metal-dependent hydrolase (beta-lactamase superfamily II)/ferredoxin